MIPSETLFLTEQFSCEEAAALYQRLRQKRGVQVLLDCARVEVWPTARIAFLADLLQHLDHKKIAWLLNGLPPAAQKNLNYLLYDRYKTAAPLAPATSWLERLVVRTVRLGQATNHVYTLLQDSVFWTIVGPFMRHGFRYARTLYEVTETGVRALPIVALIGAMMGLVLTMQAAVQMRQFGATIYVANLVSISIVRELGPLLAAILMAGRSGSAIAAEIGSMVSSEEMDALRAMGVSITKYVVVPKFVALIIVVPCLAVFADVVGVGGGYCFSILQLGIPSSDYINQTLKALKLGDLLSGLTKCVAYAVIIATTSVHQGLSASGGAEGIGKAATKSVVNSVIFIVVADLVFTILFYYMG